MSDNESSIESKHTECYPEPLFIDLSWARPDLMGICCPFCEDRLDWEMFKYVANHGEDSPHPLEKCRHVDFVSADWPHYRPLPIAEGPIRYAIEDLWSHREEDFGDAISNISSLLDPIRLLISDLEAGTYYYLDHTRYYGQYIESALSTLRRNYGLVEELSSKLQVEWEGFITDYPGWSELVHSHFNDPPYLDDLAEEYQIQDRELSDDAWDRLMSLPLDEETDFAGWCAQQQISNQIVIFTAYSPLSDKLCCVVYSSNPANSEALEPIEQPLEEVIELDNSDLPPGF